ncbi:MFS transporter [Telluria beijingensis]|uniref:MFS transporter n=1 Tax=Telluria beijingensis TaxID=3068633 RepID=UPI002796221B|nr:MFS transporter [Massilia sp. REN29]
MTAAVSTPARAGWRQGWILVFSGFLPVMAILALAPTLPTLMAHFGEVPYASVMVPLLVTAPSAGIALFAPAAGVIADRFGRRRLMLGGMVLYGVGGLIPLFIDNFWAVVAGRVVIGLGEAGLLTAVNTLLADYYEEKERHRWLALQGVVGSLLGSLTIAGSGFLAAQGWQWPFLVYAVSIPIFLGSLMYLFEPAPRQPAVVRQSAPAAAAPFPYLVAAAVCGVTVLLSTLYYVQVINFSLLLRELGIVDPKAIGLRTALPSLGVPLGAILFILTVRFGARMQILLVFGGFAIGLCGIGLAPDYRVALGFAFIQQVASGIIVPALISWAQGRFDFEHRGRGMGWWSSSFFVAQFLSPAVVNLVRVQVGSLQAAFLVFGLVAAAGAVAVLVLHLKMPMPRRPRSA